MLFWESPFSPLPGVRRDRASYQGREGSLRGHLEPLPTLSFPPCTLMPQSPGRVTHAPWREACAPGNELWAWSSSSAFDTPGDLAVGGAPLIQSHPL